MDFIRVTSENIENEHICCAISGSESLDKKRWMEERFDDGLVFLKADVRGKAFIEYIPAEFAWNPIKADGFMHINCFWIAGKYQHQGIARQLMEQCIADAKSKEKKGITYITSAKMHYVTGPKIFEHFGFKVAEKLDYGDYQLLYLPFEEDLLVPEFLETAKIGKTVEQGFEFYFTNQCPFAQKYSGILAEIAKNHGKSVKLIKIDSAEQAQKLPFPISKYSLFYNGEFVTHEIFSPKKFEKMFEKEFI